MASCPQLSRQAVEMDVRDLSDADPTAITALSHLFDEPANPQASHRFVQERTHHLLAAYIDDAPVGFVSGVEMTHPDKGTEMFLYELGVDDAARRQGIGTALVRALATKARDLGCQGMWVLTDEDNEAALRTYRAAGGGDASAHVMLSWTLD